MSIVEPNLKTKNKLYVLITYWRYTLFKLAEFYNR